MVHRALLPYGVDTSSFDVRNWGLSDLLFSFLGSLNSGYQDLAAICLVSSCFNRCIFVNLANFIFDSFMDINKSEIWKSFVSLHHFGVIDQIWNIWFNSDFIWVLWEIVLFIWKCYNPHHSRCGSGTFRHSNLVPSSLTCHNYSIGVFWKVLLLSELKWAFWHVYGKLEDLVKV